MEEIVATCRLLRFITQRHCMTVIKHGGSVWVMASFVAQQALALIEAQRITRSRWVPTMFVRQLKLPAQVRSQYDVSSLQVVSHAAAPCTVQVKDKILAWWRPIIFEYYAGTENNGFSQSPLPSGGIKKAQWVELPKVKCIFLTSPARCYLRVKPVWCTSLMVRSSLATTTLNDQPRRAMPAVERRWGISGV
jgi:acyl-coenzyme A synthetase/AMP-(fatty) acid ligase